MIENIKDEIYELKNKQVKGTKLRANIRWQLDGKKWSKIFFKVLQRQIMQNQTVFELYTDNNKSKYSSNPKDILEFARKIMRNPAPTEAAT